MECAWLWPKYFAYMVWLWILFLEIPSGGSGGSESAFGTPFFPTGCFAQPLQGKVSSLIATWYFWEACSFLKGNKRSGSGVERRIERRGRRENGSWVVAHMGKINGKEIDSTLYHFFFKEWIVIYLGVNSPIRIRCLNSGQRSLNPAIQ